MIIEEPATFDLDAFIDNADQSEPLTPEIFEQLMEGMFASAHSDPGYFLISPQTALFLWRLGRIRRLNEVCPLPQRKLRKFMMRKIYAKRREALQRIRQKEQSGAWMDEIGQEKQ